MPDVRFVKSSSPLSTDFSRLEQTRSQAEMLMDGRHVAIAATAAWYHRNHPQLYPLFVSIPCFACRARSWADNATGF